MILWLNVILGLFLSCAWVLHQLAHGEDIVFREDVIVGTYFQRLTERLLWSFFSLS